VMFAATGSADDDGASTPASTTGASNG
jgi:hypothetical protein